MSHLDAQKVGMMLRKRRRSAGKTLEDMADDCISMTTISKIERGGTSSKTPYLAEKLGVNLDEFVVSTTIEGDGKQRIKNQLTMMETIIDLSDPDEGLAKLEEIHLEENDLLRPLISYLKGKCFFRKKKWARARPHFLEAVRLSPEKDITNICTVSWNELSAIAYFQNRLDEAVSLTQKGIDAYHPEGERSYSQYIVMANRAIYLEILDRNDEAMKVIHHLWEQWNHIKILDVSLHLYELKATILTKRKMHQEALELLKEAIDIARVNRFYQRAFSSWVKLGKSYMELHEWEEAEQCFLTALCIEKNVSHHDNYIFVEVYVELSSLYLKQGKWKQAEEMLEKSLKLSKKHNDKLNLIKVLLIKGDIYRKQGMFSEAIVPYAEALELSREYNYPHLQQDVLHNMAACWEKVDHKKFQNCLFEIYKMDQKRREEGV